MGFEALYEGAYRLKIPFENIYTSVFLLFGKYGSILVDNGNNAQDVETFILPALREIAAVPSLLLCSHLHDDHCGGTNRLLEEYPSIKVGLLAKDPPFQNAVVLHDGQRLSERFTVLSLSGHTADSLGLLDTWNKTLFSFDCLQGKGVGRFTPTFADREAYRQTLERIMRLNVRQIIASHEYAPYGYTAKGFDAVKKYITASTL